MHTKNKKYKRPIYSSVTCGDFYYWVMFISPISWSTNALHTTELVAEALPSQSFFCFASKSRSTLFLKGSSANAWVELLPITDPINNTIEGISMVLVWSLNLDSSCSYGTFSLYEVRWVMS